MRDRFDWQGWGGLLKGGGRVVQRGGGCLRGKGGVLWLAEVSFPPPSKEQRGEGGLLRGGGGFVVKREGGVFLLEVQYSILKSLISTCVLSYIGSREDWLLDRICES